MKTINFEAKNLEEAYELAVQELRVSKEYIDIEVLEKKGMLKKTLVVEAKINVDAKQHGYKLLTTILEGMGIDANVEMRTKANNQLVFSIDSDENPLLIGKNGKTLENIQFYLRTIVNNFSDEKVMVLLDVGGYKDNRKRQLEILATKTAKDVARSKVEARLEPMNAYERRIIHTKLSDWRDVSTISEGEGSKRHLVIKPKRR